MCSSALFNQTNNRNGLFDGHRDTEKHMNLPTRSRECTLDGLFDIEIAVEHASYQRSHTHALAVQLIAPRCIDLHTRARARANTQHRQPCA